MAGRNLAMQGVFARVRCTASHLRLAAIEGEPGTGKLLLAQTLHSLGLSAGGPFTPAVAVDFVEDPQPIWQQTQRGLLYLARVDELSSEGQQQLRDILERAAHARMRPHGVPGPMQVAVGTAHSLRRLAAGGTFRSDLAVHLTAIRFMLPPLRERREDIALLASVFLQRWSDRHHRRLLGFRPDALDRIMAYAWPGNVRELESVVSAAALDCPGEWIRAVDIPPLHWPASHCPAPHSPALHNPADTAPPPAEDDPNLNHAILRHVAKVLARAGGNKVRASRLLGISRSTLYRLLEDSETPFSVDNSHKV